MSGTSMLWDLDGGLGLILGSKSDLEADKYSCGTSGMSTAVGWEVILKLS